MEDIFDEKQKYSENECHLNIFGYESNIKYNSLKDGGINIIDSYLITSDLLKEAYIETFMETPGINFGKRSSHSLFIEWKAHNILYKKNIFKKRTMDTGLSPKESLLRRGFYRLICFIFNE